MLEEKAKKKSEKRKRPFRLKVYDIIGLVFCLLLLPIVVVNMTFLVQEILYPNEIINFMGYTPLVVSTGSMQGEFDPNDLILIKKPDNAYALQEGQIITFRTTGHSLTTHRIVGIEYGTNGTPLYVTKGDANNTEDRERVSPGQVVGVYIRCYEDIGSMVIFMQTPLGRIMFVAIPLLILLSVLYLLERRLYRKKEKEMEVEQSRMEEENARLLTELQLAKQQAAQAREEENEETL